MITLIQGGEILSPEPLGKKNILILNDKIGAVFNPEDINITGLEVHKVDATGKFIAPGFVDSHVHILGGGGEGGPATRAPEIRIEDIIASGVTTLIGCLGTDGTTRHMESLLAKAKALEIEGISTYLFTGSYQVPVVTITGSVRSDIALIDKIIGAGEIAISDHRSSQPTFEEFARLASECRVGGMLGGKAGVLHCHLGAGTRKLEMFFRLIEETEIPITQVIPTHCNRNLSLLEEGIKYAKKGGYIDFTAGSDPGSENDVVVTIPRAIRACQDKNAPLDRITVSSDANGSLPIFDEEGNLKKLTVATEKSLLQNFKFLITKDILPVEEALKLFSTNPSKLYRLDHKGEIKEGKDADLIILDQHYGLDGSFVRGQQMMSDGQLCVSGTFSS
ncbi:beta-aspartyl-peptidase [Acidobacteriota bacterium]